MSRRLRASGHWFPAEFGLYRFCREFHCLPQDVLEMEDHWYDLFRRFLRAEAERDMLEHKRQQQSSPR